MNRYFSIWHLLLYAWVILGTYFARPYLCDCWCSGAKSSANAWRISDANAFSVNADQHFRFMESGATYIDSVGTSLNKGLVQTVSYLKSNPEKTLLISGNYTTDEKAPALFPNLGLARANDVKSLMILLGASATQIDIQGNLVGSKNRFKKDTLLNGIDFSFVKVETADTDNHLKQIKDRLLGKPMIIHFALNQKNIILDEKQKEDFSDMTYYMDKVATSKLDIAGHTDNQGKPSVNEYISQQRAESVSAYIAQNGNIQSNRLVAKGFGPNKPIVPNTTSANKAINRRVEIILE